VAGKLFLAVINTVHIIFGICNRLRMFENRVLRGILGPKRDKGGGVWKNSTMGSFIK
jgi:hypothetical protein